MEMNGVIYKIENRVNGKVYVGQTIAGYEVRIGQHKSALRHNRHSNEYLQRAWNKYGENNFECSIIETTHIDNLDIAETEWISKHKSEKGVYNFESGGNKNKRHSKESIEKMAIRNKENMNNPLVRKKLKEHWNSFKGASNPRARKVICINTQKTYDTLTEASNDTGIPINDIYKVCNGERITAGFHLNGKAKQFAYYEEGKTYNLKEVRNLHERKRVVLTNTQEVFDTAAAGAKKYDLSQGSISSCCRGNIRSAGRLPNGEYSVWVYEKDYDPKKDYTFHRHLGSHNPRARKVICLTTDKVFETMKEAGAYYNIKSYLKISEVCRGKRKHCGKLTDGTKLKWAYYENHKTPN